MQALAALGPPRLALQGAAQLLVLLHGLVGMALCGACTHHVIVAVGYLRRPSAGTGLLRRVGLAKLYAWVTAGCYLATFVLGLLAYPTYRYFVRGLYFDWHQVWASNLFDIKENFAALGLPMALALLVMSRSLDPESDRTLVGPYVALVIAVAAVAWFAALSGLLLTLQRGVPA